MSKHFIVPDTSDKRIEFAADYLQNMGYELCENESGADFALLGINPPKDLIKHGIPCFAGNIKAQNVYDYTKDEAFATANAYLTAEGAIEAAVKHSDFSLVNSCVLITGYGRIAKALHRYLAPFTQHITVCARSESARILAEMNGAKGIDFEALKNSNNYDYIFNSVPHPVFNEAELKALKSDSLLIDLASFPGGADVHLARHLGVKLIIARGLPAKCSPKAAGRVVAETVDKMIREVIV